MKYCTAVHLKPLLYLVVLFVLLNSCNNSERNDLKVLDKLNKSLENSTKNIELNDNELYRKFEDKINEPYSFEKGKIWYPKATSIQLASKQLDIYLSKINTQIENKITSIDKAGNYISDDANKDVVFDIFYQKHGADSLYKKILEYRLQILAIDEGINKEFNEKLPFMFASSGIKNSVDFYNTFFKNTCAISALAVLGSFRNDIKNIEIQTVRFCFFQLPTFEGFFDKYGVLVSQNSSHLKAGETLEISAGVGAYSTSVKSKITIDGKSINIFDGTANYKLKSPGKPGKYSVPVKVNFVDENGKEIIKTILVKYTVDE